MCERPSIAREISDLLDALPGLSASSEVRVAWFRRKAEIQRRIAAETDSPSMAEEAAEQARESDQRADEIEGGA
ncbi:MAG TPA: hypothetical protein VHX38_13625 [Pseudonocardiaceae bacterium]|jgi:hypothetical protein|nr:hypothetical protein [Pseudonocardiaceae bacterium]